MSKGATIEGFSQETENGKTTYEIEMVVDGHTKDVELDACTLLPFSMFLLLCRVEVVSFAPRGTPYAVVLVDCSRGVSPGKTRE